MNESRFKVEKVQPRPGVDRWVVKDTATGNSVERTNGGRIYRYKSHARKDAYDCNRMFGGTRE